jgi:hypothetical protein
MDAGCITITFGDVAENGVGMQKIGEEQPCKFKYKYLVAMAAKIEGSEIIDLVRKSQVKHMFTEIKPEKACVLVIRNFPEAMAKLGLVTSSSHELFDELLHLKWDKKALMRGVVKNKLARHNLCFSDFTQKPKYEEGKGRVYNFKDLPRLTETKECVRNLVGMKTLVAEGNLYYDVTKCGIGYHGDKERNIAIGLRLGTPINLYFQWYHRTKVVSKRVKIKLKSGDLYIMSTKAVGKDWRCTSQLTLRHAAGCDKYTK